MTPHDPRPERVKAATEGEWDVIVIGGGASGLGTALEAATRGYRTLLLEARDYAQGTSSRSTKLIHGGVRYLAQGRLRMTRESLRERGILRRNAPHLVRDLRFVIPVYARWQLPFYASGLAIYDRLAGSEGLARSRRLSREETLAALPNVRPEGLKGGILYHDGQFDDSRFAIALLRSFETAGGIALNAAPVTGFVKTGGRIGGVRFTDAETGIAYDIAARAAINATGIFADALRRLDDPAADPLLALSQGAHVVVSGDFLPGGQAMLVPKTDDGRVLFALPWHGRTLLGTTDSPVTTAAIEPVPLPEEIDFILRTAARYLARPPGHGDILSLFAGQRPLVKSALHRTTKALSREHLLLRSASGLVTLTGGKWTTYRRMGEETIDFVETTLGWPHRPSRTPTLKLHGYSEAPQAEHENSYGSDAPAVRALPGAAIPLHPRLPYREADIRWAVRHEQARSVEDILARRLRALFLDAEASREAAPRVAAILAEELGRNAAWQTGQLASFQRLAEGYLFCRSPLKTII